MGIKFVFFDLYGTLVTFRSREAIQKKAAQKYGIQLTDDDIGRGYAKADELMSQQNAVQPVRLMDATEKDQFFTHYEQLILSSAGDDVSLETAQKVWHEVSAVDPGFAPFPDVKESLLKIKDMGLGIGLISNMDRSGEELMESLNLKRVADLAVTSHDAGVGKPDPAIFELALKRANVSADEVVHVGDQLLDDITGASSANIQPILIDRHNSYPNYTDNPKVAGLSELVDWLSERK